MPTDSSSSGADFSATHAAIQQALSGFAQAVQRISAQIRAACEQPQVAELFQQLASGFSALPERLKSAWSTAVENGWYPNAETAAAISEVADAGPGALDAFMTEHLREDWETLTTSLLAAHPQRAMILHCAFELHRQANYIAAIPLFITQAEGIIAEKFGFSLFMDKSDKAGKVSQLASEAGWLDAILIGLAGLNTQLHAGSGSKSPAKKSKAPSRNGILHGSRHHLDYGTEINSFKMFSLLAFTSFLSQAQIDSRHLEPSRENNGD